MPNINLDPFRLSIRRNIDAENVNETASLQIGSKIILGRL